DVSSKFNATDFRKREVIFQPRKKKTALAGEFKNTQITTPKSHKRIIKVHDEMSIEQLCKKMSLKRQTLIKTLKKESIDTKNLKVLDFDTIALVIPAFGFTAKNTKQTETEILQKLDKKIKSENLSTKAPVVTIMGHVDHGKTTLLDCIRKAKVAQGEAGGITQHIGAYSVFLDGKPITFIDTPGHSAFTAMRSRGAQATDIVVIVIAGDDGVQPQTIEALNHAKAAKTPIIIAISKMDSAGANPDKIKKQMSEHNIIPEDWGGDTSFIPISALKEEGIKELLDQIQLQAEMQELKYQAKATAKGLVLEAKKEKGMGCIVSLLIQDGTLYKGDNIVAGECSGRVRQLKNDKGHIIKEVSAGFPVEIIGFNELPQVGDKFCVVSNEKSAKELLTLRKSEKLDTQKSQKQTELNSEELLAQMEQASTEKRELNIILKSDVGGSLEALKNGLEEIKSEEAVLKIIHSGSGAITESDVLLASTVSGVILGFNVRPDSKAVKIAKEKSVEIYSYSVVYELFDQVKNLMLGLLKSDTIEEDQGQAEVRDIFHISKIGTVAGCYVVKGKILRSSFIRLVRDGRLVYNGPLSGLRRFKEDVKQVGEGFECGISLEKFNDIKPKDVLECYTKKEQARTKL
ncbi:MAG: translation initiation factor IF-2, partial [Bdellovibrionaceae bacterium]|nr:translation initiation factor IF-2 [Pseudobdellovibrionaceae bacterium]